MHSVRPISDGSSIITFGYAVKYRHVSMATEPGLLWKARVIRVIIYDSASVILVNGQPSLREPQTHFLCIFIDIKDGSAENNSGCFEYFGNRFSLSRFYPLIE